MKAYQINIAPRTESVGFVTVGENEPRSQSSQSLLGFHQDQRQNSGPECNISIHESQKERNVRSLEHLENQVGLLSKKNDL
jgi:hypothetical protein